MKKTKANVSCALLMVLLLSSCAKKNEAARTEGSHSEIFVTANGAIDGYDAVAFFTSNMPVKGNKQFTYRWNDATWNFANAENLQAFKNNPGQYVPQYGGYCAYGTAEGHKAPTQPDTWTIINEKLYFNYNNEVKEKWRKDQNALIEKANNNWPEVKTQEF